MRAVRSAYSGSSLTSARCSFSRQVAAWIAYPPQVTIDAILEAARRAEVEVGVGKNFVTELQQCIRIRTGESGGTAI